MATTVSRLPVLPYHRPFSQRCLRLSTTSICTPLQAQPCRPWRTFQPQLRSYQRRWSSATNTQSAPSTAPFTFSVAASYIGKDRPFKPEKHVFHFNPHLPGPAARKQWPRPESGQDAFFVSRIGETGGVALGVADGVGGWMDSGVDPADFSHGLCGNMASAAWSQRPPTSPKTLPLSARRLLQEGYEAVCADRSIPAGGSTAVVGLLTPDGCLEVANLGDSGFVLLRLSAVMAASVPQIHAFNTPFQLSAIPPNMLARMATFGGAQLSDMPRDADVTRHRLRHGDVLVFASDGVWDNLFNQDILRIVAKNMASVGAWHHEGAGAGAAGGNGVSVAQDLAQFTLPEAVQIAGLPMDAGGPDGLPKAAFRPVITLQSLLATQITSAAKAASTNTKLDGPFSKEVKKYYPHENWRGGKVDDICVVVAVVSEQTPAPA